MRQAVILCGGKGTRLGELTANTPKPLLDVAGRPFLDYLIQDTTRYGFREILLLAGHFGDQIYDRYHNTKINNADIKVVIENKPLGTAGGLVNALEHLDDEFILRNGDSWLDVNLSDMIIKHTPGMLVAARHVPDSSRYDTLEITGDMVTDFIQRTGIDKPNYINGGVYKIRKEILADLPKDTFISLEHDVMPSVAWNQKMFALFCNAKAFFIDIGIPVDFKRAQTEIPEHVRRPAIFLDRDGTLNHDDGYTHKPEDLQWITGAKDFIATANRRGYYVFVVSNQAGVSKGHFDEHYVLDFLEEMQYSLRSWGANIDGLKYCIDIEGPRRKPNPGMLNELLDEWLIDRERSFMIGDKDIDVEAATNAGITGYKFDGDSIFASFKDLIDNVRK